MLIICHVAIFDFIRDFYWVVVQISYLKVYDNLFISEYSMYGFVCFMVGLPQKCHNLCRRMFNHNVRRCYQYYIVKIIVNLAKSIGKNFTCALFHFSLYSQKQQQRGFIKKIHRNHKLISERRSGYTVSYMLCCDCVFA